MDRNTARAPLLIAALLVPLAGCGREVQPPVATTPAVTIMTFNVENLFDTRDDPGKDDGTFLPLNVKQSPQHQAACTRIERRSWRDQCLYWDWNEAVLEHKLGVVARAILQVGGGRGPDVLALQEVENSAVLERLRTEYLAAADYRHGILIEGGDNRGIDVAFLARLPLAEPATLHPIPFAGFPPERVADTRGILEATFELPDGTLLTGYAVHFPAPYNPRQMRVQAYRFLNSLKAGLPPDRLVFAAGDFNTTSKEDREHQMLASFVTPSWRVAHREGCRDCPPGTSYFPPDRSWSFLDMIIWSAGSAPGTPPAWDLRTAATYIANGTPDQVRPNGTPADYQLPQVRGVSDHWPLVITIEPR